MHKTKKQKDESRLQRTDCSNVSTKKKTVGLSTVQVFLRKNYDDLYLLVHTMKLFNAKDALIIPCAASQPRPAKQFLRITGLYRSTQVETCKCAITLITYIFFFNIQERNKFLILNLIFVFLLIKS